MLVEAEVGRVERGGRGGGQWALRAASVWVLLLDEGTHVERSVGFELVRQRGVMMLLRLDRI